MIHHLSKKIAIIALLIILGLVNFSIAGKEKHLKEGQKFYLELAPVDPRSLMQGDYMRLDFALGNKILSALQPEKSIEESILAPERSLDGQVVVKLDEKNIATFERIYSNSAQQTSSKASEKLSKQNLLISYRIRDWRIKFATDAYFFQEGQAKNYENARYGQFSMNDKGELLLVALHDAALNELK